MKKPDRLTRTVERAVSCDPGYDNGLLLGKDEILKLLRAEGRYQRALVRKMIRAQKLYRPQGTYGSGYNKACDDILAALKGGNYDRIPTH